MVREVNVRSVKFIDKKLGVVELPIINFFYLTTVEKLKKI